MSRGAKILIVDDEPDILLMLRVNLEGEGYETALAADGETAVQRIADERPALVLLDVMMPVMDGWAVLESIGQGAHPPRVIVVSAKASDRDVSRAVALGAQAYVTKPFDPDDLVDTVRHVLTATDDELAADRQRMIDRAEAQPS